MKSTARAPGIVLAALLCTCCVVARAQTPSDPVPMPAPSLTEGQKRVTVTGAVRAFTRAPTGAVDGFLMHDGTFVHFPPFLSARITAFIGTGSAVRVTGVLTTGTDRDGQSVLEAQTISNLNTNQTMKLLAAPSRDQGPARATPENGADAAGTPPAR